MNNEQQRAAFESAYIGASSLRPEDIELEYDYTQKRYHDDQAQSTWEGWQMGLAHDRQGRGEPVCFANINKQGDVTRTSKRPDGWSKIPLYAHPQPAEPVVKESLTVAEPVKEVSESVKRIRAFIDRRKQMRGLDQTVIAGLDGAGYALLTVDLLALLSRYGQPAQQEKDE